MIIYHEGFGLGSGIFYVKDPDGNGIWEDRDGDGVADICDGAPDDPDEGYYKDDEDENGGICFGNIVLGMGVVLAGVMCVRRREKSS
ncbi:MAG: hypothetical protein KAU14_08915 [Thermoplasmata archaeon]|nr:hypothetical protein [Thermoplasmata archaeon]